MRLWRPSNTNVPGMSSYSCIDFSLIAATISNAGSKGMPAYCSHSDASAYSDDVM